MRTADFDYFLPEELIAQFPAPSRDQSRLMVVYRLERRIEHKRFSDLPSYLHSGDVLVLNDSKVIPARLWAIKPLTGGLVEILLLESAGQQKWWALVRPAKRVKAGSKLSLISRRPNGAKPASATQTAPNIEINRDNSTETATLHVMTKEPDGRCLVRFGDTADVDEVLHRFGEVPLPPYLGRNGPPSEEDRQRYQTVYARTPGSVAAPTAGLHFTERILDQLRQCGVKICFLTLHVGLATFAPVKSAHVEDHTLHEEFFDLPASTAQAVNAAKRDGRRVVAVGTTVTRVLESVAIGAYQPEGAVSSTSGNASPSGGPCWLPAHGCRGRTRLFIYPPYAFRVVDVLLTNFHLPRSTLLMLVAAFAAPGRFEGRDFILSCYSQAVEQRYRFYSYGDAMLIV